MQKSDNHYDADMAKIRIQALEWVQGTIQDIILNDVTTDCFRMNKGYYENQIKFVVIKWRRR